MYSVPVQKNSPRGGGLLFISGSPALKGPASNAGGGGGAATKSTLLCLCLKGQLRHLS